MKEYKTIHSEFLQADDLYDEIRNFDKNTNELMKYGWTPHGQVQFVEDGESTPDTDAHIMVVQTMVR